MNGSILTFGEPKFLSRFSSLIQDLGLQTIESVPDLTEAVSLVQAQQPDLLLVQSELSGSVELCRTLKEQSRLSWIYIIAVHQVTLSDWFSPPALALRMHYEQQILDAGADAFAWCVRAVDRSSPLLVPTLPTGDAGEIDGTRPIEMDGRPAIAMTDATLEHLLSHQLKVQIQVGLRRVCNYRELMRTNDLLSAIALSDPLTELNNRRAFEWEMPRQIQNARARNAPISLLVLDVDYFKSINDNYGHLVGDRALQLLAARLRHNLRFCDTPFRYGGEEFIILLSDTDEEEALRVGRRLRRRIAEKPFALTDTLDITITISIGSASLLPSDDERGISLLNRADQNLLLAKARGRNQVVSSLDRSL